MSKKNLHVLIVEDNEDDALLVLRILQKENYAITHKIISTPGQMKESLQFESWDVIISDYSMPGFSGEEALELFQSFNLDIPFILVSGTVGEDIAVDMMKRGAQDYIMKSNLRRVIPTIEREINEVELRKQKKSALEALRVREEQYRNLINNMHEGLIHIDLQEKIVFANKRFCSLSEYTLDELIGAYASTKIIHPSDREIFIAQNKLRQTRVAGSYEIRMIKKSSEVCWTEISGSPLYDDNGESIGSIGLIIDITKRKETEMELRASEEKYRGLAERISDLVLIVDKQGKISFITPSVQKILGYTPEELLNEQVSRFLPVQEYEKISTALIDNFDQYSAERIETVVPKKDGTNAILEFTGSPIFTNHKVEGIQVVGRDITEQKHNLESIRKLFRAVHQSSAAVLITNLKGEIEYINPKFTANTGYTFDEVRGRNPKILKSGYQEEATYSELWNTILSGQEWIGEICNKKKNGELYWEINYISAIRDDHNAITHFLAIKEDITHKKELELELKRAIDVAEESSRLKSSLLSNISHELRTPMTGILGMTQILLEELSETEFAQYIRKIQKSGSRLMATLGSILDYSQLESNMVSLNLTNCNLAKYSKYLLSQYENFAHEKQLNFTYTVLDDTYDAIVDESLLNRILINLVENAIKYTNKGGIEIIIDSEIHFGVPYAVLRVKDTGIGIELERQSIIFQEFRQASEGFDRNYEGTGLGLTIAKKMIELMHGSISVISTIGVGSEFTISLPATLPPEQTEVASEETNQGTTELQAKTQIPLDFKTDVLLVEDNLINIDVIVQFLFPYWKVDFATSGATAIKLAQKKTYPIVLMDINLGSGKDGISLMQDIKAIPGYEKSFFIAVTGYAMITDRDYYLSQGFDEYLAKPFTKEELTTLLTGILVQQR
ncbi:MAG: PAS domain S-box protein [Ignavibacteria bacterium]|nr:PAS domain S-box protein [Ignavibacteria bacterium]